MIDYSRNGDGTGTLTLSFTGTDTKAEEAIELIAQSFYTLPTDGVPFENLTNQEKLDIINDKVKSVFLAHIRNQRVVIANDAISTDYPEWS